MKSPREEWYESDRDEGIEPREGITFSSFFAGVHGGGDFQLPGVNPPPGIRPGNLVVMDRGRIREARAGEINQVVGVIQKIDIDRSGDKTTVHVVQTRARRNGIEVWMKVATEAYTARMKELQKGLTALGMAVLEAQGKTKHDPRVPTRPPHSMTPRNGRAFDRRGRKRY